MLRLVVDLQAVATLLHVLLGCGLVPVTDHERTRQRRELGLIDHIALSKSIVSHSSVASIWERINAAGETMSDHSGVAIDLTIH